MKPLFDSNILIDFLQGNEAAQIELNRYSDLAISRITWIEILVGAHNDAEMELRKSFLGDFNLIELNGAISREAVDLRRQLRLKLPDAIIFASARVSGMILVTRNHRDFPVKEPGIRVPY